MKHLTNCDLKCDTCITKYWVTDKEWNYSQITHLPITLVCQIDGEHIVRGTNACVSTNYIVRAKTTAKNKNNTHMKTATLRIQCRNSNEANAVVAQLNQLAAHRTAAIPFTNFLCAASKEGTSSIAVVLTNCTKKETVTILRDILTYYKCFGATGQAYCTNPLTKCEIKIISLPFKENTDISEQLKQVNELCKAKFKPEDLQIN